MNRKIGLALVIVVVSLSVTYYAIEIRIESTPNPGSQILDIPSGNNKLAIEFYKQISNSSENIFFSPPALYATLAALYEGADGDAAVQIQELLSLETDRQKRHDAISQFLSDVYRHDRYVRPEMAGVLWLPDGIDARDEYQKSVKAYGMDIKSGISEETIDRWAADETNGRISDVVSDNIDTDMAVITNVADFEGEWWFIFSDVFDIEPFQKNAKESIQINYLDVKNNFYHAFVNNTNMLEIQYAGEKLSMLIIMPSDHRIKSVEESLTVEMIERWKAVKQLRYFTIHIPMLPIESNYSLKKPLGNLGVTDIFASDANLGGIASSHNLHISEIFQKSFINITSWGTNDIPPYDDSFDYRRWADITHRASAHLSINSPFIFLIYDNEIDTILFMGRVSDPTA